MTNSPLVLPPLSNNLASPLKKEGEHPVPFEPIASGSPASFLKWQGKSIEHNIAEREERSRLTLTLHQASNGSPRKSDKNHLEDVQDSRSEDSMVSERSVKSIRSERSALILGIGDMEGVDEYESVDERFSVLNDN